MINLSCIIAFLLWKPDPEQLYLFFVLPALWGMADAVWQTQANGKSRTTVLPKTTSGKKKDFYCSATTDAFQHTLTGALRSRMTKIQNGTKPKMEKKKQARKIKGAKQAELVKCIECKAKKNQDF